MLGTRTPVALRVGAASVAGLGMALLTAVRGPGEYAPAAGWIAGAVVYLAWTWATTARMDAAQTREHALFHERDGTRHVSHVVIMAAGLTSLAGVGFLLHATSGDEPDLAAAVVGVLSVMASWFTIHTVYTLRYARLYYNAPNPDDPGMRFDGPPPTYLDFAYLDFAYVAFTIGMCYGVSDNNLNQRTLRKSVLSQGLISYGFGAIVIAITLNLVSELTG